MKNFHTNAAYEAGKIVFACIGVGSTLANIGTMHLWMMLPASTLVLATWAGLYRVCE